MFLWGRSNTPMCQIYHPRYQLTVALGFILYQHSSTSATVYWSITCLLNISVPVLDTFMSNVEPRPVGKLNPPFITLMYFIARASNWETFLHENYLRILRFTVLTSITADVLHAFSTIIMYTEPGKLSKLQQWENESL